jgi:DNA-directed RNA polymerase subunit RPC12/RpoP
MQTGPGTKRRSSEPESSASDAPAAGIADGERRLAHPDLLQELLRRRDIDQIARSALVAHDGNAIEQLVRIADDNAAWLRKVVDRIGWPGWSSVGEEGSHAAWLLAQHADRHLPFQRHCLALLEAAARQGDASPEDAAHLTDRVLLASGEQQVYGTQLNACEGRYVAPRLRDPKTVNARRAAVGMVELEEHLSRALDLFGIPAAASIPCSNCGSMVELWLPELGGRKKVRCGPCGFKMTIRARIASG